MIPGGISLSPQPYTLNTTLTGNGKAEVIFKLDPQSVSDLTNAGFNATTIIGMAVNLSNVSAGAEGFYLSNIQNAGDVPEPSSLVLGLAGMGLLCRFRKSRR